ncbi:hypothetical protein N7495_009913 [Penicillium taxi]|uniref:uncharacterized protein n=1 Tax=Penicillium taxi TaxID=168475 RepID=UPI002544EC25|nr:uncharacterized protein N7495_009913 [Penicillium taxi]KAJ5885403.1 hypothetical protein N7495_009913 [Penicillium taxi]
MTNDYDECTNFSQHQAGVNVVTHDKHVAEATGKHVQHEIDCFSDALNEQAKFLEMKKQVLRDAMDNEHNSKVGRAHNRRNLDELDQQASPRE